MKKKKRKDEKSAHVKHKAWESKYVNQTAVFFFLFFFTSFVRLCLFFSSSFLFVYFDFYCQL